MAKPNERGWRGQDRPARSTPLISFPQDHQPTTKRKGLPKMEAEGVYAKKFQTGGIVPEGTMFRNAFASTPTPVSETGHTWMRYGVKSATGVEVVLYHCVCGATTQAALGTDPTGFEGTRSHSSPKVSKTHQNHTWRLFERPVGKPPIFKCGECDGLFQRDTDFSNYVPMNHIKPNLPPRGAAHQHRWGQPYDVALKDGSRGAAKRCESCDAVETQPWPNKFTGIPDAQDVRPEIVDYDPITEMVKLADGTGFSLDVMLREAGTNDAAGRAAAKVALEKIAVDRRRVDALATMTFQMKAAASGMKGLEPATTKLTNAMKLLNDAIGTIIPEQTTDSALEMILDEVRESKDPFKTGGKWMAKFTNALSEVMKEGEADE